MLKQPKSSLNSTFPPVLNSKYIDESINLLSVTVSVSVKLSGLCMQSGSYFGVVNQLDL